MGSFGRRPITDAAKGQPRSTFLYRGEERLDRRPQGKVERWVDPQGNVTSLQMAGDGDPRRVDTINKMRVQYHRKGFVEHAKCPVRHGITEIAGPIAKDFSVMRRDQPELAAACDEDPRVMKRINGDLHAQNACPHIEWLIAYRQAKAEEAFRVRNAAALQKAKDEEARRELEKAQLDLVQEQIADRRSRRGGKHRDATE